MRTSMIAIAALIGLAGWQLDGIATALGGHPARTAYEDSVERYQDGQSLQRSTAPQRTQPMADAGDMNGVDNARLADGATRPAWIRSMPAG